MTTTVPKKETKAIREEELEDKVLVRHGIIAICTFVIAFILGLISI